MKGEWIKMRMKRKLTVVMAVVMILSVAAFAVGCGSGSGTGSSTNDTSLQEIKDNGKLVIGCDDAFPPMGFVDDGGQIVGFDIDLATAVAEKLGVDIEVKAIDWSNKELELTNKKIDVIWNGYTINSDRNKQVEFTKPYLENTQRLVVRADSPIQFKADLAGKVVGVQVDSAAEAVINSDKEFVDGLSELRVFNTYQEAMLDLKGSNRLDAVGGDEVLIDYIMTQDPGAFRILDDVLEAEYYGVGCRKGAVALREAIDKALDDMEADGSNAEISNKWFGRDDAVLRNKDKLTDKDFSA
jgi:polar amino acid transport system substrate-binding protein